MKDKYRMIVEKEKYDWQKGNIDFSHLQVFLFTMGFCLFAGVQSISFKDGARIIIGTGFIVLSFYLSMIRKRKVYFVKEAVKE